MIVWPNETRGHEINRELQGLTTSSTPKINDDSLKPGKISTFVRDTSPLYNRIYFQVLEAFR